MKEFALVFRTSEMSGNSVTPAQMQERMTSWMNWMGGIAAKDRLVSRGNRLGIRESRTIDAGGVVMDGPYVEVKEFINGMMIVKAESLDEAVELARECPILQGGGKVEVRLIVASDDNK